MKTPQTKRSVSGVPMKDAEKSSSAEAPRQKLCSSMRTHPPHTHVADPGKVGDPRQDPPRLGQAKNTDPSLTGPTAASGAAREFVEQTGCVS